MRHGNLPGTTYFEYVLNQVGSAVVSTMVLQCPPGPTPSCTPSTVPSVAPLSPEATITRTPIAVSFARLYSQRVLLPLYDVVMPLISGDPALMLINFGRGFGGVASWFFCNMWM